MIVTSPWPDVVVPEVSITDYVLRHAARLGDKPALIDGPTGRTLTYRQLAEGVRRTAAGRQVLCVTHLAPIAAHASHHLVVDKRVTRGATRTSVTALDEAGRVEEIARMLGGERVTEASRRHARSASTATGMARRGHAWW